MSAHHTRPAAGVHAGQHAVFWTQTAGALDLIADHEFDPDRAQSARADAVTARRLAAGMAATHTAHVGPAEPLGVSVLDDAAHALAERQPSRGVGVAEARQRMAEAAGPALTPGEIRAQAAASWGLPVLTDPAQATAAEQIDGPGAGPVTEKAAEPAEPAEPAAPGAELADKDDWAWQL